MKMKFFTFLAVLYFFSADLKANCPTAPTNLQVTQTGAQVFFSWVHAGATSYIIEMIDPQLNLPFEDSLATYRDTIFTPSYTMPFSFQGYSLEWRVRALCQGGEVISAPSAFSSECAEPTGLIANSIGLDSVVLNWSFNGVPGESYYWAVAYRVVGSSAWISLGYTTAFSKILKGLQPGTQYEWCVNQSCSFSSTYSDPVVSQFTTQAAVCGVPVPRAASNITSTSAILNWDVLPQATSYTVQWFINNFLAGSANVTTNSLLIQNLAPGTTVMYRVSASCPYLNYSHIFSTFVSFTTLQIPPPPGVNTFFIDYFKVGSIERVSQAEPGGYVNTGLSTNVTAGQTYQFRVSMGSTGTFSKQNYAIFLDINGNGSLESNERLFGVGAAFNANMYNLNLTIPTNTSRSQILLRVIMKTANGGIAANTVPGPGIEIEDYWLNVQGPSSLINNATLESTEKTRNVFFENPASEFLQFSDLSEIRELKIFNTSGQEIMQKKFDPDFNDSRIDISGVKEGYYFIELNHYSGHKQIEKLLIQK